MAPTKNIIFDLGGVLINLDFARSTQAFKDLGFLHFENMFSQFKADQLFEKLEMGLISDHDFYTVLQRAGNHDITQEDIKNAWNSMLLDFREASLNHLNTLQKDFNLYLLSNTNIIHHTAFNAILKEQAPHYTLDSFFKKAYYSHQVGLRKPNNDIFDFVLEDAGIIAEESLFIDDTFGNITTAQNMGFKTHLLLPNEKIENLDY